ncbi:hypothetical protein HYH03_001635 [Edaphochlamys debaryana]|uniref:Apple domain-containing protein n=1 Tax=Edaphochlamys debaryana TaxID=47281 RepID=A0A836C5G2_9CHLO|nr:hypothetical protein HYH03_001635 [Edaphochlamys debaryana]|eukprot:KAG2500875.1 hypothetical protein HYH03_001635 [Edaphochlamys debaryana]
MRCGSERSGARCVNQPFAPAICRCNFRPWPAWNASVKVCQQDFTHHCPFGRLWNATAGRCTDFDECANPDIAAVYCGLNATCANHDGSYSCSCQRYFRHWQFRSYSAAPGTQACYDEDGCVLGTTRSAVTKLCIADTDPCVLSGKPRCGNGTCTAQGSSFTCSCPLNYRWSVADNACVGVCDLVPGQRYWGGGFTTGRAADVLQPSPQAAQVLRPEDCAGLCAANAMCRVFVWRQMQCYLLSSSYTGRTPDDSYTSGACWFRMPPGAQNVALRGPTMASSVLASSLCVGGSCASRLAVDGSASSSGPPPFSLFQSFSNASDRFPWVAVDLSTPCLVEKVVIYNRRDCCGNRLVAAELRLGDQSVSNGTQIPLNPVVWKQSGTAGAVLNITLPAHRQGRFITLQNRNPSTNSSDWALNILEIEVYGHRLTEFNECSILGPASCDSATSTCQNIFGGAYKASFNTSCAGQQ